MLGITFSFQKMPGAVVPPIPKEISGFSVYLGCDRFLPCLRVCSHASLPQPRQPALCICGAGVCLWWGVSIPPAEAILQQREDWRKDMKVWGLKLVSWEASLSSFDRWALSEVCVACQEQAGLGICLRNSSIENWGLSRGHMPLEMVISWAKFWGSQFCA